MEFRKSRLTSEVIANTVSLNVVDGGNERSRSGKSGKITPCPSCIKIIPCQICSKRGREALNCFNQLNVMVFPPQHNRVLTTDGTTPATKMSINTVYVPEVSIWYPDSGATNHVTSDASHLRNGRACNKFLSVVDGRAMEITHTGNTILTSSNSDYVLDDLLIVPSATKN